MNLRQVALGAVLLGGIALLAVAPATAQANTSTSYVSNNVSSNEQTKLYMDGVQQDQILIRQGVTLVQLTTFNDPAWVSYQYDAKTKSVLIQAKRNKSLIRLTGDTKEVFVNGKKVQLNSPIVYKDGRTYVPLRFISERLGGTVTYDKEMHKIIVRTPSGQQQYDQLMTADLAVARTIALQLPKNYDYNPLNGQGEGFTISYTFPWGEALRYYKEYKGLVEYIEIDPHGNAEVKWQQNSDPLVTGQQRERGMMPKRPERAVFFLDSFMTEITTYGIVDSKGVAQELGRLERTTPENKGKVVLLIENEERIDSHRDTNPINDF